MATEPNTSTLTKVYYSDTKEGAKTQIAFVQSIPQFLTPPEPINWSALDIDDERQAPGRKKAESMEIEFLFAQDQYQKLKEIQTENKNVYWFIQLPEETAETVGKPLTWNFQATCFVGMSEIALDDMLKSKITLYRNTQIEETEGFPAVEV